MPWWQKSSKEPKKQGSKEVSSEGSQNRLHNLLRRSKHGHSDDDASSRKSRQSLDLPSEAESPRSPSPPTPSTRSPSFRDRPSQGPPLPLPCAPPLGRTHSGNVQLICVPHQGSSFPAHPSLQVAGKADHGDVDGLTSGCGSGSGSSVSSIASAEQVGAEQWSSGVSSRISNLRPAQDGDIVGDTPRPHVLQILQGSSVQPTPRHSRTNSRVDLSRPASPLLGGQPTLNTSRRPPGELPQLQLHANGVATSAPDSSMSSPSRSPRRPSHFDQGPRNAHWQSRNAEALGSNPGSGQNSAQNSSGGEVGMHLLSVWQRASPERSPILSPILRSPGPGSRGQSATASPFHPAVGGRGSDSPSWHDERMAHPLPLPPPAFSNNAGFASPSQFASLSPRPTRSESARPDAAPNEWKKGKLIGSGTFGNVYVGFNSNTGRSCAMKEVLLVSDDCKSRESAKQLEQEIAMLSQFQHPNIVQYYASDFFEDKLYIYLEYVSGGSIHKLLQDYGAFKEPLICNYTRQILQGLSFLHSKNTVHRDIKGANILVNNDGEVKVADFGMAKHISIHQSTHSLKGTAYWMAPEVINQALCVRGYDLAVDIWSLGCTVIEMATAKPPWSQYEGVAAMFKIGHTRELPQIPDLSDEAKYFIRTCLKRNPAERPTAVQLLEHPFVKKAADDRVSGPMFRPDDRTRGVDHVGALSKSMRPLNVGKGAGHRRVFSHDVESTSSPMLRGWSAEMFTSESPRALGGNHQYQQRSPGHLFIAPVLSPGTMTPPGGAYGSPQVRPFGAPGAFPGDGYRNVPRSPNGLHARSNVVNGLVLEPRSSDKYRSTPGRTPEGSPRQGDHHSREDIFSMSHSSGNELSSVGEIGDFH